ncbi:MAG: hypothetical protein BWY69_00093 [Planctomycetes bacterium ADurb.Bin401]|nr:MAG: hypothetical protein BWY69_00093 [Planctomycetes bacterium ADurb.Bin401]
MGKEELSGIPCDVVRAYGQLDDYFPRITTYWIDSKQFIPIRILQIDTSKSQYDFVYNSLNTTFTQEMFMYDGPVQYKPQEPEPLGEGYSERNIIVHDGSDGRMSGRWGKKGSKGTSSSGLN